MQKSTTIGFPVVIITAFTYFMSCGVIDHWGWLMWAAPFFMLLYSFYFPKRASFIVAFSGYVVGNAAATIYLGYSLPSMFKSIYPIYWLLLGNMIDGVIIAIFILLTRFSVLQLRNWLSIFIFPSLWTAYEFYTSLISPAGTIGSIAYSQVHWLSLIQIASMTGIWGITFLLSLLPAAFAIAWYNRAIRKQAMISLVLPVLMLLISVIFGCFRLYLTNANTTSIPVGMVTIPETIQDIKSTKPDEVAMVVDKYLNAVTELANNGAKIILLPEKMVTIQSAYSSIVFDKFLKTAKEKNITIIAGFNLEEAKQNVANVFTMDGNLLLAYNKRYMVKFSSEANYHPGNQLGLFFQHGNALGLAICHDVDFQALGRQYGQAEIGILFVPALDFVADAWLHARVAIMRGVENGYAVVRTAGWGLLTMSDAQGRIVNMAESSLEQPVLLSGIVTMGEGNTFYARSGDWLPLFCSVFAFVIFTLTATKYYLTERKNKK